MTLPTTRALALAGALSAVATLGYVTSWALDGVLLVDLTLVALIVLDGWLAPRVGVRREAPAALSVGRPSVITYHWTNPTRRRARLRVRELRPEILGGLLPARPVAVPPGGYAEALDVLATRRGRESSGGLHIESVGPLGLGRARSVVPLRWDVIVFPTLAPVRMRASVAAARRREAGLSGVRRLGEGRVFESLREWVPGDDTRTIDWKATARRRRLITRQYEAERRQHVLLIIDAGRLMTAELSGTARLEHVVQAALELAYAAVQHDDDVGVMAFADGVLHFVAPLRGRSALRRVAEVLAVLQPRLVEPDYPGAFRYLAVRNRKRALTVLFTDVIDRHASETLVAHVASLRPRHLPLAVTLRNPELDRVATARPTVAADAFRKAAAEELLRAREEAVGRMRRAGVLVLDVAPERAAVSVVDQYQDLKRRGVL